MTYLDHDTLAVLHDEGSDEDKENVVEEEGGEKAGADFEARQAQHLQEKNLNYLLLDKTSAPIRAWKRDFPLF